MWMSELLITPQMFVYVCVMCSDQTRALTLMKIGPQVFRHITLEFVSGQNRLSGFKMVTV